MPNNRQATPQETKELMIGESDIIIAHRLLRTIFPRGTLKFEEGRHTTKDIKHFLYPFIGVVRMVKREANEMGAVKSVSETQVIPDNQDPLVQKCLTTLHS